MKNLRKAERFADFGRIENSEICIVSGVLEDISTSGIKVSYSVPPSIDMDKEYEVSVRLSRVADAPLKLIVKPVRICNDNDSGKTYVGFSILHSKDSARLCDYLSLLKKDSAPEENPSSEKVAVNSLFI